MSKFSTQVSDYPVGIVKEASDRYGDPIEIPTELEVAKAIRMEKISRWVTRIFLLGLVCVGVWLVVTFVSIPAVVSFLLSSLFVIIPAIIFVALYMYAGLIDRKNSVLERAQNYGVKVDE